MRMMRFQISVLKIYHVPGKSLYVADMLSRAPLTGVKDSDRTLQEDTDVFVNLTMQLKPAGNRTQAGGYQTTSAAR